MRWKYPIFLLSLFVRAGLDSYAVRIILSLPMSLGDFTADKKSAFKTSLAKAAGVADDDVTIDKIESISRRSDKGIRIESSIKADVARDADVVAAKLTQDAINDRLSKAGLPEATMLETPMVSKGDAARREGVIPSRQVQIVNDMRKALMDGAKDGSVQRRPHWVLVSSQFYAEQLRPQFVELSLLYCDKSGIDSKQPWVRSYLDTEKVHAESEEAEAFLKCSEQERTRLNMIRIWLHLVLPHILQKVDRVSFGLMNEQDCKRALAADPRMPRSRLHLAIPFVGKDAPSPASEFAHPDVLLGLTILAYRYYILYAPQGCFG